MTAQNFAHNWQAPLAVTGGTLALVARVPSPWAVLVTATVGALGAMAAARLRPAPATGARGVDGAAAPTGEVEAAPADRVGRWLGVLVLGCAPFLFASTFLMSNPLPRAAAAAIAAGVVAAVAEEVFFRKLVYGWLERWGDPAAVVGAAALFAAIHVPVYGAGVLPLDFAAGLIFGWQRRATGGWTAPAATHVFANLLASL